MVGKSLTWSLYTREKSMTRLTSLLDRHQWIPLTGLLVLVLISSTF